MKILVGIILSGSAVMDIKNKSISIITPAIIIILGIIRIFVDKSGYISSFCGLAVGIGLFIVSIISKEQIGKGDAFIIGALGFFSGIERLILIFLFSGLPMCLISAVIFSVKRNKHYCIPMIPFLFFGYAVSCWC